VPEFRVKVPQATVSEELAQCPYVVAKAGVEPMSAPHERQRLYQSSTMPHNVSIATAKKLLSTT